MNLTPHIKKKTNVDLFLDKSMDKSTVRYWELTYPIKNHVWRWFSELPKVGYVIVPWRVHTVGYCGVDSCWFRGWIFFKYSDPPEGSEWLSFTCFSLGKKIPQGKTQGPMDFFKKKTWMKQHSSTFPLVAAKISGKMAWLSSNSCLRMCVRDFGGCRSWIFGWDFLWIF